MAKTLSNSSNYFLALLRQTLAEKLLANMARFTNDASRSAHCFNEAVERLSLNLAEAVARMGLVPTTDGSVQIGPTDLVLDATTIAAKIHAIWSDKPSDLIIFCVQKMEDARESEKQARLSQRETEDKLQRLLERLAAAEDMHAVRDAIRANDR